LSRGSVQRWGAVWRRRVRRGEGREERCRERVRWEEEVDDLEGGS
jgi:hypothetical protein